jgi:hypothetical protein
MLTQAIEGMQESAKGALAGAGKGADPAKYAESARQAWQRMLADMQALAAMVQKAQTDAMAGLTQRAKENIDAVKGLAHAK